MSARSGKAAIAPSAASVLVIAAVLLLNAIWGCARPCCGGGFKQLDVHVQPTLVSIDPMEEGSKVLARWDRDTCLRLAIKVGNQGEITFAHEICLDLADPDHPAAFVGEFAAPNVNEVWRKVPLSRVKGSVTMSATGGELGQPGGPDLFVQYAYQGLQSGSWTYQKGGVHLRSDELVR